jgi:hypothetical protein
LLLEKSLTHITLSMDTTCDMWSHSRELQPFLLEQELQNNVLPFLMKTDE